MTPYNALVRVFVHLDRAENLLDGAGGGTRMEVIPLSRIAELRRDIIDRAISHGIVPEDTTVGELRHEASKMEVVVQAGDGDD